MDFQSWIEGIDGLASLYSFDVLEDGSFSEIRLMAVNKQNVGMLQMNPNAPEFYPGIPYRNYWMDLNFESFVYKCASTSQPLYSYVNARGVWLKGFYIPIKDFDVLEEASGDKQRTVYCLYIITYSDKVETDSMSQKSSDVANAVMEISIKIHETPDFVQSMAAAAAEIKKICGAEKCSLYTVDKNRRSCSFIGVDGIQDENLDAFAAEMGREPYEVAETWERDLALSDCLLLEDLKVIEERDPEWYHSLILHDIHNIILYAVRSNQTLVGFIWVANYDVSATDKIKETLEICSFLLAAVIYNNQLLARLEVKSMVDELTQLSSRNALNDRVEKYSSSDSASLSTLGVVFADLNGLKTVNDEKGHEAGDKLLVRAASLLKIGFGDWEIYRAGGDEFVILCPGVSEEVIEKQLSDMRNLLTNTTDVSFAFGTAFCTDIQDVQQAIQTADEEMYKDKELYYLNHPEKDRRTHKRNI
ncbi:diguanylate cyclase (GGDEF) domain-containing protein [Lachnospiraceae bacterium NE2001]|nr:diguanylate cyclase (GGDEF) domain-containing protein [Lachnospiraceae bacterium NE2001]